MNFRLSLAGRVARYRPPLLSTRQQSKKRASSPKIGGEYHELQAEPGRSWREHHSSFCNGMLYFRDYFPGSYVHNDSTTTISEILHN
jgi:hypothetical protein